MNTFRILLADEAPVFRFGLRSLLGSFAGWEVCGEASDGWEVVEKCGELKPDLLILDICLPKLNGVGVARRILKDNPRQRILVLTNADSEQAVRDCLEAGVRGWILKCDGTDAVTRAVEALQQGKSAFSAGVSNLIVEGYLGRSRVGPSVDETPRLTPRECEVVQLISEGKSSKEVSVILGVAVKTTETHRGNIMRKLKLHSTAELVMYAVRKEIVHVTLAPVLSFPELGKGEAGVTLHSQPGSFLASSRPDGASSPSASAD